MRELIVILSLCLFAMLLSSNVLSGAIYKCTENGQVTYQEFPCYGDNQERIKIDPNTGQGVNLNTGERYKTRGSNSVMDQYGNKGHVPGRDWERERAQRNRRNQRPTPNMYDYDYDYDYDYRNKRSRKSSSAPQSSSRISCGEAERRLEAAQKKLRRGYKARESGELRAERDGMEAIVRGRCD